MTGSLPLTTVRKPIVQPEERSGEAFGSVRLGKNDAR